MIGLVWNLFASVRGVVDEAKSGAVSKTQVFNALVIIFDILFKFFPNLPISGEFIDAFAIFLVAVTNMLLYVSTRNKVTKSIETVLATQDLKGDQCL